MRTQNSMKTSSLLVIALGATVALTGCRIEKPATQVPAPPTITAFTASASEVEAGGKLTLTWATTDATSVELREASAGPLDVPVDRLQGTYETTVDASSLYVLVARGPGGTDARALAVNLVDQGARDVTLQALPPEINGGDDTTLVWTAPGARSVTLTGGGQPVDTGGQRGSGAVTVSPRFDTTYTLVADGVSKTATVSVSPVIIEASLSRGAANVGDALTISWRAAGGERLVLSSPGRGTLTETTTPAQIISGSFTDTVPPTPNNGVVTYELTLSKGATQLKRTLELRVGTGLAITSFTAPPVAAAGATYIVRWNTANADRVDLSVDGVTVFTSATQATAASGSYGFNAPLADFTVELVAHDSAGGKVAQQYQVDAVGVPTAVTLTANPTTVASGQPVTLTWASAEARRVRIVNTQGEVVFSLTGQPAEGGTATVYPVADTTFTISADNQLGNAPVTATAAVTVTGAAPALTQYPPTAITGQNVELRAAAGTLVYGFPHNQVLSSAQADFIDISGTGARIIESGGTIASIDLGFSPLLWGRRLSGALTVSRNGWMAWGTGYAELTTNSTSWPSTTGPGGMIAPFWDALTLVAGTSGVYAQLIGNAPEQVLVVQWDKLRVGSAATTEVTFQVQVHQRGMVSFQYQTMTLPSSPSFLVGIQDFNRTAARAPTGTPASNSATYFFAPVSPPLELRAVAGVEWSGYLKSGSAFVPVLGSVKSIILPTDLALTELMHRPNPAVPAGQYIEIVNRSTQPFDLQGWQLSAPNTPTFSLGTSLVLQPNVPVVIGASTDPAQNDDAGVALAWGSFTLSPDAGTLTLGTADAGVAFSYAGPADGGTGVSFNLDLRNFVGDAGPPGPTSCASSTPFGGQAPQQLGSPGALALCDSVFPYTLETIPSKFVNLTDAGTPLLFSTSNVDQRLVDITLAATASDPAPLLFGVRVPAVTMSTNGWMSAITTMTNTESGNLSNPNPTSTTLTPGKLAIFWEDLESETSWNPPGEMYWKRFAAGEDAATPLPHWVFSWNRFSYWLASPADDLNFQVKLFDDGAIEYHYGTMVSTDTDNYADGHSATVWLEKPDATLALVLSINQGVVRPNTAFRFVPR